MAREGSESVVEFGSRLLQASVDHAWSRSTYYRRLWGDTPPVVRSPPDLAALECNESSREHSLRVRTKPTRHLPMIDKGALVEHGDDLATAPHMPDFIRLTGGTLGAATMAYSDRAESNVWTERTRVLPRLMGLAARKLCLNILVPTNGAPFLVPGAPTITVPLVLEKHFGLIEGMLKREFRFEGYESRISTLVGNLDRLKLLTVYFIERGYDFSEYQVSVVMSGGSYLSHRWKTLLAETWGALVIEH
jgi:phenylacetate-coenzyme A ligase PaaK-like adenylate-forming protein